MIQKDNSISSKIRISCRKEGDKTLLVDSYFDIPYKVVHYGSKLLQQHLEVMMMCYSPGVMDGDQLDIEVLCPALTEMKLFTQSFNKLHPMKNGAAQRMRVQLGKNALFQFLPQPTIPFQKAIFNTSNDIYLENGAHLIWGDIISGGRIHSGERFAFTHIHSKTRIYQDKKLIFFDNQLIEPGRQPVQDLLFFEGHTHQGTLLLISPYAPALKEELDAILLEQFEDMSYGYTQCAPNGLLIRALGESGDALHEWLANVANMCWSFIQFHSTQQQEQVAAMPGSTEKGRKAVKKILREETAEKNVTAKNIAAKAKKPAAKKTKPEKKITAPQTGKKVVTN